jgi:hypothetical protein
VTVIMPETNKCANCLHHRRLFFTGRKWICEDCWTDEFGPMPSELTGNFPVQIKSLLIILQKVGVPTDLKMMRRN